MRVNVFVSCDEVLIAILYSCFDDILSILLNHWDGGDDCELVPFSLNVVVIKVTAIDLHFIFTLFSVFADIHQQNVGPLI
jgi:hypothetical protein